MFRQTQKLQDLRAPTKFNLENVILTGTFSMNCLGHLGMLFFQAISWKVFAFNQGVSHVLTHLRHQGSLQQHGTLNTDMMPLIEASKNPIDVALNGFLKCAMTC